MIVPSEIAHAEHNAILYVLKSGCQWRMLPHDFTPWQTVYDYYRRWNQREFWQAILDSLNTRTRVKQGKKPSPSDTIVDSQSVKTQYDCKELGLKLDIAKGIKGQVGPLEKTLDC